MKIVGEVRCLTLRVRDAASDRHLLRQLLPPLAGAQLQLLKAPVVEDALVRAHAVEAEDRVARVEIELGLVNEEQLLDVVPRDRPVLRPGLGALGERRVGPVAGRDEVKLGEAAGAFLEKC